ncbi:hypothetical protein EXIGLDRAFT_701099 [Exidia glandulosa HHB12029]|uniref:Uncharacterized protein n=1 Tax=Exidia glandulosa HHB12029 TaxID=1314781 RepID=A0A165D4A4_EXIGL|nr:hypothetical protein EXIGLDRAFT_701099 [Exidia glandulosa HHB12029]
MDYFPYRDHAMHTALGHEIHQHIRQQLGGIAKAIDEQTASHDRFRTREEYERCWTELLSLSPTSRLPSRSYTYMTFPWPMADKGKAITTEAIRKFLVPDSKAAIRRELKRWHPDKFSAMMDSVVEVEREKVKKGAEIVVRCLNELLQSAS